MARGAFFGSSGSSNGGPIFGPPPPLQAQVGVDGGDNHHQQQQQQQQEGGENGDHQGEQNQAGQEQGASAGHVQGVGANPAGSGLQGSSDGASGNGEVLESQQGASQWHDLMTASAQRQMSDAGVRQVQIGPSVSYLGLNRRRLSPASLQARCTAALMSPCTVTTHSRSMNDSAASSPTRLSPTSVGPGLLSTVPNGASTSAAAAGSAGSSSNQNDEADFPQYRGVQVHAISTMFVHSSSTASTASNQPLATTHSSSTNTASNQPLSTTTCASLNSPRDDAITASTSGANMGWTAAPPQASHGFEPPDDWLSDSASDWLSDSASDTEEDKVVNNNHIEAKCCESAPAAESAGENVHLNDDDDASRVNGRGKNDKTLDTV